MSKFITDTESIEKLLDQIESRIKMDNNNNFSSCPITHSQEYSTNEISNLFKKILEIESKFKYIDIPLQIPRTNDTNPTSGSISLSTTHSIDHSQSMNGSEKYDMSSALDILETLSETIKKNEEKNDEQEGSGKNIFNRKCKIDTKTNVSSRYGLTDVFYTSKIKR
jgi:hypothetical protein